MNKLKELIIEVERLDSRINCLHDVVSVYGKDKIKQTVEAVDKMNYCVTCSRHTFQDWQKLKKLLGVK